MDHVVYLDAKAKEMENLLSGKKSMIIRGAAGRKMPYGRVSADDVLYFINNNAEGKIRVIGQVASVFNSEKMTKDESISLVEKHQKELQLSKKQINKWSGKRYLVLIRVIDIKELEPFEIDRSNYGNMDDWLRVEKIENVRK